MFSNLTSAAEQVKTSPKTPAPDPDLLDESVNEVFRNELRNMQNAADEEDSADLAAIADAQARLPQGTPTLVSRTASALQGSSVLDTWQKAVAIIPNGQTGSTFLT